MIVASCICSRFRRRFSIQIRIEIENNRCYRGFHELLPFPTSSSATFNVNDFRSKVQGAGISRLLFLRHGQASLTQDGIDFNRRLTDEGRSQVACAGRNFGCSLLPFYRFMLVSPSPRTTETESVFLTTSLNEADAKSQHKRTKDHIEILPIQIAYDGTMQPEGSAIFKKLGYAPLINYIDNTYDLNDAKISQRLLGKYALDVMDSIIGVIDSKNLDEKQAQEVKTTLVFVGHSIYLPAVVLGIACVLQCDESSKDLVLKTVTGEAEGYLIDIGSARVTYQKRQPAIL